MTTVERLRQLHEQASADGDAKQVTVLNERESALYVAAYDHLPALLDIAEAAQRRAVTHALHVAAASAAASHDQQYLDVINALFAALARLEQP